MWLKQDQHPGDRLRLFREVGWHVHADRVLYPGSYVDVAASFTFPSVTYVDSDDRAAAFFADRDGVQELVGAQPGAPEDATVTFIHSDYRAALPVPTESCDLLVSLFAGFVSEFCTQYLRVGGALLVNPSHGDAAMASIDPASSVAPTLTGMRMEPGPDPQGAQDRQRFTRPWYQGPPSVSSSPMVLADRASNNSSALFRPQRIVSPS